MKNFTSEIDLIISKVHKELNLRESQIAHLQKELTGIMRNYYFPLKGGISQINLKFRMIRSFWKIINEDQKEKVKKYQKAKKEKNANRISEKAERQRLFFINKIKRLQLSKGISDQIFLELEKLRLKWEKGYLSIKNGDISFSERMVAEDAIYQKFLSSTQWETYKLMKEEEVQFGRKQSISMTVGRFRGYGVVMTESQAALLLDFEEERRKIRKNVIVSEFDDLESEMAFMKKILPGDSIEKYKIYYQRKLDQHIENLQRQNSNYEKEIEHFNYLIDEYVRNDLPILARLRKQIESTLTNSDRNLIASLKSKYDDRVIENYKKGLMDHQTLHRNFVPNWAIRMKVYLNYLLLDPDLLWIKEPINKEIDQLQKIKSLNLKTFNHYDEYLLLKRKKTIEKFEKSSQKYDPGVFMVVSKQDDEQLRQFSILLVNPEIEENLKHL